MTIDPDAEDKALLVQTKRCILYIIRVQQGKDLLDILCKPVTHEDEEKWQELLQEELPLQKSTPYPDTLFNDLAAYSPTYLKADR